MVGRWVVLEFELRALYLVGRNFTVEPLCKPFFVLGIFEIGVPPPLFFFNLGWPRTMILLISASTVANERQQCPASMLLLKEKKMSKT
jgi:hypothetical protein